jgi:H+/Cl- antiporter ClcA
MKTITTSAAPSTACPTPGSWPTTRILFAMAGTMTLLSAVLAATLTPWFLLLTGFVALNQLTFVALGACPASLVVERVRRRPAYPGGHHG